MGDAFGPRCCPFGVEPVPVSSKASITIAGRVMSKLSKGAGKVEMETWTGGWPRWIKITVDGEELPTITPEDLRDLRYCADRLLAMIDATGGDGG